jgi:hypothetical protein
VDKLDESYFREVVQPMLSADGVEFIGEISEKQKGPFLRDATALLFPICWPEPLGLLMIEAMACGTPVLAYRAGAVPEVIDEGVTGMIVDPLRRTAAIPVLLKFSLVPLLQQSRLFDILPMLTDRPIQQSGACLCPQPIRAFVEAAYLGAPFLASTFPRWFDRGCNSPPCHALWYEALRPPAR